MTDGWNARPLTPPPASGQSPSPWWSDAVNDPWRDPYTPTAVVVPSAPAIPGPAPESVPDPDAPRRSLGPILAICLVTALLAGGLGGTLGYVFAVRGGVATGGGTRLQPWMQAIADATGRPVEVSAVAEGAALGAAFLARMAAGLETISETGRLEPML